MWDHSKPVQPVVSIVQLIFMRKKTPALWRVSNQPYSYSSILEITTPTIWASAGSSVMGEGQAGFSARR